MLRVIIPAIISAVSLQLGGAAHAAERKLLMSSFKNIVIEDDIAVELTTGKSPKARVIGDKKDIPNVSLERRGRTLVVKFKSNRINNRRRGIREPIKLVLQNHDLQNVTIRGNGSLYANTLTNPRSARILLSGNGELKLDQVDADQLTASVIGNGNIAIGEGQVNRGLLEIQGGGIIDAARVRFTDLDVTHQGNGQTTANAKRQVSISNNGRGQITVSGKGSCLIEKAGSATINCQNYAD